MSEPRERGIQFSGAMVQALLAGRKTVTRRLKCRYKVGDLLYIRETWGIHKVADGTCGEVGPGYRFYRADHEPEYGIPSVDVPILRWRSPMFMPKWAARPWRGEVTDIREERLNEITEEQAIAEGVERTPFGFRDYGPGANPMMHGVPATYSFQTLWNSLHGPDAWAANPVVYAISL